MDEGGSDLYKILGIPPDSDEKTIKKEFNKKCKLLHPDRHPDKQEEFCELTAAFNRWKDANKKKPLDEKALKEKELQKERIKKELEAKRQLEKEEELIREQEFKIKKRKEEEKKIREENERKRKAEEERKKKEEEELAEKRIREIEEERLRKKEKQARIRKEEKARKKEEEARKKEEEARKKEEEERLKKEQEALAAERKRQRDLARIRIEEERRLIEKEKQEKEEIERKIKEIEQAHQEKMEEKKMAKTRAKTPTTPLSPTQEEPKFTTPHLTSSHSKPEFAPVKTIVKISLQEAINGVEKEVKYNVNVGGNLVKNVAKLKIPACVKDGHIITLKKKGNMTEDGIRQNADFEIHYNFKGFIVDGSTIIKNYTPSIREAIEAKNFQIDFPDGGKDVVVLDRLIEEGAQDIEFDEKGLFTGKGYGKFIASFKLSPVVSFKFEKPEKIVKFTPPASTFFDDINGNCKVMMPKGVFDECIEITSNVRIHGSDTTLQSIISKSKYLKLKNLIISQQLSSEISIIIAKNCHFKGPLDISYGIIAENCSFDSQVELRQVRHSPRAQFINCQFSDAIVCNGETIISIEDCTFTNCANSLVLTDTALAIARNTAFNNCEQPLNISGNSHLQAFNCSISSDSESDIIGIAIRESAKVIGQILLDNARISMVEDSQLILNKKSHIHCSSKNCITSKKRCQLTLMPGVELSTDGPVAMKISGGSLVMRRVSIVGQEVAAEISGAEVEIEGGSFKGGATFKNCIGKSVNAIFAGMLSITGEAAPKICKGTVHSACFNASDVDMEEVSFNGPVEAIGGDCVITACKFYRKSPEGTALSIKGAKVNLIDSMVSYATVGIEVSAGHAIIEGKDTQLVRLEKPLLVSGDGEVVFTDGCVIGGCCSIVGGTTILQSVEFSEEGTAISVDGGAITVNSCSFQSEPSIILNDGKLTAKHQKSGKALVNGGEYTGSGKFLFED